MARAIALITTVASIAVTLVMALLAEQATKLIMQGLALQGLRMAQEPREAEAATMLAKAPKGAAPARKPLTSEQRMAQFVRECFREGGEATGGEVYQALEAWWICHAPGQRMPS